MANPIELREKARVLQREALANAQKEDRTGEDEQEFKRLREDAQRLTRQAEDIESMTEMRKNETAVSETRQSKDAFDANAVIRAYIAGEDEYVREHASEQRGVFLNRKRELVVDIRTGMDDARREEMRVQGVVAASDNAAVMPQSALGRVETAMRRFNSVMGVAEVITTADGNIIKYPTSNDVHNKGEIIEDDTTDDQNDETVTYGAVNLGAYLYTSKPVLLSETMIEDTVFDVVGHISDRIGERLGRATSEHFTTGDNANKPQGIVSGLDNAAVIALSGNTPTTREPVYNDLVIARTRVDPSYRMSPSCGWMMNSQVEGAFMKIRDTLGRPIWTEGFTRDAPNMLLGKPVTINDMMADAGTSGNKFLLFGDLMLYKVRRVGGMRMYRLNELYRERDQVALVAFTRCDGRLVDPTNTSTPNTGTRALVAMANA